MKNKSEVISQFMNFYKMCKYKNNGVMKYARFDNGTEYTNHLIQKNMNLHGYKHQTTCVELSLQNKVSYLNNGCLLKVAWFSFPNECAW